MKKVNNYLQMLKLRDKLSVSEYDSILIVHMKKVGWTSFYTMAVIGVIDRRMVEIAAITDIVILDFSHAVTMEMYTIDRAVHYRCEGNKFQVSEHTGSVTIKTICHDV
jgi:hypothetical protein